jgi:hypothetical protein
VGARRRRRRAWIAICVVTGDTAMSTTTAKSPKPVRRAGVIALPPFIFLGFLVAAVVLEAVVPLPVLAGHALARYVAGAVLAVAGFVIIFAAAGRFVAAGTNIPPNLPTTALVVDERMECRGGEQGR